MMLPLAVARPTPRIGRALSLIAALAIVVAVAPPAGAADVEVSPETVAVRIDVAGRQRMLTQRMAKSFCYARSGVDVMQNAQTLANARDLYTDSHRAFAFGDEEMRIFVEQDPDALAAWERVDDLWSELTVIYAGALGGAVVDEATFGRAMELALEVMNGNNDYVAYLRQAYADQIGGGTGAAILIDLYGRQRMLSQKLSKDVCLAAWGYDLQTTRAELEATIQLFDNSINAFIDGLPIAGVPPAPTDEIGAQLERALAHWEPVKGIAVSVSEGRAVGLAELATFNKAMDAFLPEMNTAVGMLAAMQKSNQS